MKHSIILLCSTVIMVQCGLQIKTMSGDSIATKPEVSQQQTNCKEFWDECVEKVTAPAQPKPSAAVSSVFMKGKMPESGFAYIYGGKTAYKMQPSSVNGEILACYLDGNDYSGVTVALGQGRNLDLTSYRKAGTAGLAFWGKGGPGTSSIFIGIIDDESDGKKVQTKVRLSDFGVVDTNWRYYMIPVRKFLNQGRYWDDNKKIEIINDVDWGRINEIRFSVNKGENRVSSGEPVKFYVDDIAIIKEIPGYIDPQAYWENFQSNAQDIVLNDFDSEKDKNWYTANDPKSQISVQFVKSTADDGKGDALSITYSLIDWCDALYSYKDNNAPAELRDWTKHWGIKFNVYTERPFQPFSVQIQDASNELFLASAGAERGWTEVIVPFKTFEKFPYYQPPEADQNGKLDLNGVVSIDFKPSGEGTKGTFVIENIRLTNDRVAKKANIPEQVAVTVNGNMNNVITQKINPGIFGINAALWDGDLLNQKTVDLVKDVNHSVLRYPGGLRADEDHWKEVLAKKDFLVDIDEFLDLCKKTNTTPMITVNFGTGTVQDAADWVRHTNIIKKANVKYWEVGNELYGDWHPNHCTGEAYGKKAREFVQAMKVVDPSIHVTVVWMLAGDWNKDVFKYTSDVADGVNVHHYPQGFGEENDAGLLSAPQTLDDIIPDIKKQLSEFGVSGKEYQIWLTEWNSVDFKPGPQTLSMVNGLFVADYLGSLVKHNIDQASYWDIHNDITEQGGDYGYISRTGAPDGDNVPRPSYFAFLMASQSLGRGSYLESASNDSYVTSYLTKDNNRKSLMLINKYPQTRAETILNIPGFSGKATLKQLRNDNSKTGPETRSVEIKKGVSVNLPPHSITTITLD